MTCRFDVDRAALDDLRSDVAPLARDLSETAADVDFSNRRRGGEQAVGRRRDVCAERFEGVSLERDLPRFRAQDGRLELLEIDVRKTLGVDETLAPGEIVRYAVRLRAR